MRIGIDARTILSPEKSDAIGSGHYTYQLVRHILKMDQKNEYVLFVDHRAREKDIRKFQENNVKIVFYPFSRVGKYFPFAYSEIFELTTLKKEKLDLLHATSPNSKIPLGYLRKSVVTFNDMAAFEVSACFSMIQKIISQVTCKYMSRKADKIIVTSFALKNEVIKNLRVSDDKISVVYNGLDKRFFEDPKLKKERVLGRYGVKKKYILFVGGIEPKNNVMRLLKSFAFFKSKCIKKNDHKNSKKFEYQLVLVGKKSCHFKKYVRVARKLGIIKDIVFTDYVMGEELLVLFRNADFFVKPSLCEGFGMTVLESFATKTPAMISDIESLREIAGDGALFVNCRDVAEMSQAMWNFSRDDEIKNDLIEKGFLRAQKFDWEDAARKTIELYESMM